MSLSGFPRHLLVGDQVLPSSASVSLWAAAKRHNIGTEREIVQRTEVRDPSGRAESGRAGYYWTRTSRMVSSERRLHDVISVSWFVLMKSGVRTLWSPRLSHAPCSFQPHHNCRFAMTNSSSHSRHPRLPDAAKGIPGTRRLLHDRQPFESSGAPTDALHVTRARRRSSELVAVAAHFARAEHYCTIKSIMCAWPTSAFWAMSLQSK